MRYEIRFDDETSLEDLRQALRARFGVNPDTVRMGPWMAGPDTRPPVAMLIPPEDAAAGFAWILVADEDLANACHLGERDLARTLAVDLEHRCLVDDGTTQPDRWILIAHDGSFGAVIVDEDAAAEGDLRVLHALEPIGGEPDLLVIPARHW